MCSLCGRVDLVEGTGYPRGHLRPGDGRGHRDPINPGRVCPGQIHGPFFMGHRFVTDVLAIRASIGHPMGCSTSVPALRSALTTLAETLLLAASRVLQIDEGEMEANWSPVQPSLGRCIDLCLYDVLPGGAGFARACQDALDEILREAEVMLSPASCGCQTSCYRCLRHYANQGYHSDLDRRLGRDLLAYLLHAEIPSLSQEEESWAAERLAQALRLHNISAGTNVQVPGPEGVITVPLIVNPGGTALWVLPTHPLLDPNELAHPLLDAALMLAQPIHPIDSYSVEHRLPSAFESISSMLG